MAAKARVNEITQTLEAAYDEGVPVGELLERRSKAIDEIIVGLWQQLGLDDDVALIAVGGYGRGELHPHSDIDLLVLLPRRPPKEVDERLGTFVRNLWDAGLDVGHSVRSLRDCLKIARDDITVMTNLLSMRLLAGDTKLPEKLRRMITSRRLWSPKKFARAKLEELDARHAQFNDTSYNLEPNIKENPGGLRDVQTVIWIAQRAFGVARLSDLKGTPLLRESEVRALRRGRDHLWRLRFALHREAGRPEERLLFQYQQTLASQFGYEDRDRQNQGVERFMQRFFRTCVMLERLSERLIKAFIADLESSARLTRAVNIAPGFRARRGVLEAQHSDVFRDNPIALLAVFKWINDSPAVKEFSPNVTQLIRRDRVRIDDTFRALPAARQTFVDILTQPKGVYRSLSLMNSHGVLMRYLPVFDPVVGLMQFDLLHVYTVDQHTLFVVRNLERFRHPEIGETRFNKAESIMQRIRSPALLYLGGFFHDIAKGRGGDHSTLGETDAREFCKAHGFSSVDTELVAWLVRHHLLFSMAAQHQDVSDPEVVHQFAETVGERERLDYLYLLTIADICATSPKLWTGWKDRLIAALYDAASSAFDRGLKNPLLRSEKATANKAELLDWLQAEGYDDAEIEVLWARLPMEYFLRYDMDQLRWQCGLLLGSSQGGLVVSARERPGRETTEIFIHAPDVIGAFAAVTAVFDRQNLNVTEAIVVTSVDRMSLDSFQVVGSDMEPLTGDSARLQRISETLSAELSKRPSDRPLLEMQQFNRRQQTFAAPCEVVFSQHDDVQTRVLIKASDRPGLLAGIAKVFLEHGASVHDARIATFGAHAEDVFLISGGSGAPLSQATIDKLGAALRAQLDAGIQQAQEING